MQYQFLSVSLTDRGGGMAEFENCKCLTIKNLRLLIEGSRDSSVSVVNFAAAHKCCDSKIALMVPDMVLWLARLAHVHVNETKSNVNNYTI